MNANAASTGRLLARPDSPKKTATPGLHTLGSENGREGLLYVPAGYDAARPAPLVLSLHGAGGNAQRGLWPLLDLADEAGLLLLAPDARGGTWDLILGDYGPDVARIDRLLAETFARCAVDPAHLAVGGFSDGASYALSLGLMNGSLFTHILAFAPGFMAPRRLEGTPRIFISHGTGDRVLPIDRCSRRIVPQFERTEYSVTYREFEGAHTVPPPVAHEALSWFLAEN